MGERDMKKLQHWLMLSVLLSGAVEAGPIYSTVDANGKRVFSDVQTNTAREVKLKEGTVVSGRELGKSVDYKYGRPDSAKADSQGYAAQHRKRECDEMKAVMDRSAGRLEHSSGNRYSRECLGQ